MLIKKISQAIQNGLILNKKSNDLDNTYSCDYINKMKNIIDISDSFTKKFNNSVIKATYIADMKIVILNFDVRPITGNGDTLIIGINKYKPNNIQYDICYGSAGTVGYIYLDEDGLHRSIGNQNMLAGTIIYTTDE